MFSAIPFWQQLYLKSQQTVLAPMPSEDLKLNSQLGQFATIDTSSASWFPSPASGVTRLLLERDGGEKTLRATSIVAYAENSHFTPHLHPLGEEFFVLSGTFSDENGDYPAGTYVRNPPQSSHQPFSKEGCLIWVKLQQFQPQDRQRVVIDVNQSPNTLDDAKEVVLFNHYEKVTFLSTKQQHYRVDITSTTGTEALVLKGYIQINEQQFKQGEGIRQIEAAQLTVGPDSQVLLKREHLNINRAKGSSNDKN